MKIVLNFPIILWQIVRVLIFPINSSIISLKTLLIYFSLKILKYITNFITEFNIFKYRCYFVLQIISKYLTFWFKKNIWKFNQRCKTKRRIILFFSTKYLMLNFGYYLNRNWINLREKFFIFFSFEIRSFFISKLYIFYLFLK